MKDYFSAHAKVYAAFRPTYPRELYDFILSHIKEKESAWDCATGNGQVAQILSTHFRNVQATDISEQQLSQASPLKNVTYSVASAEKTTFADNTFNLITVAQALHWFDRDQFFREAKRVAKPGCILAVWGYSFIDITPSINERVLNFYQEVVGPYWDDARRHVENEYNDIVFPFEEIAAPRFSIRFKWDLDQLAGYFRSWSATQQFIRAKGFDPVPGLIASIRYQWVDTTMDISFPLFLKMGKM